MPRAKKRVRVAIVGGGCAGVTAAWYLSHQPGYEVTLYEKSWRLGGKGASGRDLDGRILEHGLHIWLGFYENAFRMIRECYKIVKKNEWGPGNKYGHKLAHGSFEEAFFPEPHIGVVMPHVPDAYARKATRWLVWSGLLPPVEGLPGDPLVEDTNPFTLANYILRCFQLLKTLMQSVVGPADEPIRAGSRPDDRSSLDEAIELNFGFDPARSPAVLVELMSRYMRTGALTSAAGLLQAVTILEEWLRKMNYLPGVADTALQFVEAVAAQIRKQLRDFVSIDQELRWKTEIIDIVLTIAVGLYRDRVLLDERGLDALNDVDYRKWLRDHGATKTSLDSPFMTGIYDLTFAYRKGKRQRENAALAAGVALRGALRMFFTYRGSMFWRMRSGMGDAVFAPLYKVLLLENKVDFRFLHELEQFTIDEEGGEKYVTSLSFKTTGKLSEIDRLSSQALDHFGCWPHDHRLFEDAIRAEAQDRRTLKIGEHYDAVVMATGIDDFFDCAKKVIDRVETWRKMGGKVSTAATQAVQVWLCDDLEKLGWHRGSGIITALPSPFETWADMTHTLATEKAWRRARKHSRVPYDEARSVAYFCGALEDEGLPRDRAAVEAKVRDAATDFLSRKVDKLWPGPGRSGVIKRVLGSLHVQANFQGSDRYTLSLPGSIKYRVSPLDTSVMNLSLAGDWTASGLDAGCVESAVMSGMLAAFAITNEQPALESIIGYDHP